MKKSTTVLAVITFVLSTAAFTGCSSAGKTSDAEAVAAVEPEANNDAFNSLAYSDDSSMSPDAGAVVDSANPSAYVADASTPSESSYTPSASPVNLGATSAGRSH